MAFAIGCVFVTAGSAAQIVLTQVVARSAWWKVACQECPGLVRCGGGRSWPRPVPSSIGGAPFALLADALMLTFSVLILRGLRVRET